MERCVICKGKIIEGAELRDGVELKGWKCTKCGETYIPSGEVLRWEILTGRRKGYVRKIRTVGNSKVVTLPERLIAEAKIHINDLVLFEKMKDGILLRIIHPHISKRS